MSHICSLSANHANSHSPHLMNGEEKKGGDKGDMNQLLVLSLLTHFSEWGDKRRTYAANTTAGE